MPHGRKVFEVPVPIEQAWSFLSDMEHVGSCVPGCQEVRSIDDRRSIWRVRAEMGPLSRVLKMEAQTIDFDPPSHGSFVAKGSNLETRGTIDLKAIDTGRTEVTYNIEADAQGLGAVLVNAAIAHTIQQQAEDFAGNVAVALSRK
jgi:carbon monoxide dehydrogenase subunit G